MLSSAWEFLQDQTMHRHTIDRISEDEPYLCAGCELNDLTDQL